MLRQSLTIHRELDDKAAIADDLLSLAHDLGQNQGRFDEAYTLLEEASMLTQDLGLLSLLAVIKGSLSWIVRHQGHYDAAYNLGEICLGLGRELNEPSVTSYGLWMLGSIAIARKDYAEAEALLTESMTIHQEISFHDRLQGVRVSLGYALLGLKKADQAQACLIDPIRASLANRSLIT
jgi:tetratricopeptide (TPR) repeat protein